MTELIIPYAPISLGKMLRSHWSVKSKARKQWASYLFAAHLLSSQTGSARLQATARMMYRMRVEIEVHHSRLFDKDNLYGSCKPIFDAIVSLGWAYDDRPEFMEQKVTQVKSTRKEQRTIVKISRAA